MAQPVINGVDDGLAPRRVVRDLCELVSTGRRFPTIYADPPLA